MDERLAKALEITGYESRMSSWSTPQGEAWLAGAQRERHLREKLEERNITVFRTEEGVYRAISEDSPDYLLVDGIWGEPAFPEREIAEFDTYLECQVAAILAKEKL